MRKRLSRSTLVPLLLLAPVFAAPGAAQDDTFVHPAYSERGSEETLMERTDLGNVAQTARMLFAAGNRELKKAGKLQKKLVTADDAGRAEIGAKILAAHEKAVSKFTEAIRYSPEMLEAYTALGDTYAKLGRHDERLQTHSAALELAPDDEGNFRGWVGALLALDRLADARSAWDRYRADDPPKAEILMAEMRGWLERRQTEPGELAVEDIERMADWLAERG